MSYIRDIEKEILVRRAEDFGTIDSSKVYVIDGDVDMGSTSITIPSTGIQIKGLGTVVSKMRSTQASYDMFVDAAGDCGDVFISGVDFIVSGAGSQVFNLTNGAGSNTFELSDVNFTSCTKIGILTDFRQFLAVRGFMLSCTGGWEFAGTWAGGARISTFLVRAFTGTLFKGITGLTFGSRFLSDANIDIPSGSVGYDFANESMFTNDGDYELLGGELTGAGTLTSGVSNTSVKSKWRDNNGIANTYVGSRWTLTSETATTVSASSTYYKAAGTTTYADETWFSNSTDNAPVLDSSNPIEVICSGALSLTAGNNQDLRVKVRQWDNSASAYVDLETMPQVTTSGTGNAQTVAVIAFATMEENDRIELWVSNESATANITLKENSQFAILERAN